MAKFAIQTTEKHGQPRWVSQDGSTPVLTSSPEMRCQWDSLDVAGDLLPRYVAALQIGLKVVRVISPAEVKPIAYDPSGDAMAAGLRWEARFNHPVSGLVVLPFATEAEAKRATLTGPAVSDLDRIRSAGNVPGLDESEVVSGRGLAGW